MNILLTLDSSSATDKAVAFVCEIIRRGGTNGINVTLFHAVESISESYLLSATSAVAEALKKSARELEMAAKANGEKIIERQRQKLIEAGAAEESLTSRIVVREGLPESRKVSAALAIIEEMKSDSYDVVCLGRRGSTEAQGSFLGSVAEKVLREAVGKTVWVVD
ncbi:MAG: universal stress protein [Phycisphaerales bacterium]|nr:universal stress protein [Phycisphaerales bacterium]